MTSSPVLAILKLQHQEVRISVKNRLMSKLSSYARRRDGVKVLWHHSHLVWLYFEGSIPTCPCILRSLGPKRTYANYHYHLWSTRVKIHCTYMYMIKKLWNVEVGILSLSKAAKMAISTKHKWFSDHLSGVSAKRYTWKDGLLPTKQWLHRNTKELQRS